MPNTRSTRWAPGTNSYVVDAELAARQAAEVAWPHLEQREQKAMELSRLEEEYAREACQAEAHLVLSRGYRVQAFAEEMKESSNRDLIQTSRKDSDREEQQAQLHQGRMAQIGADAGRIRQEIGTFEQAAAPAIQENQHQTAAMRQYDELGRDRRVYEALRALNRAARPKMAMGPIEK